MSPPPPAAASCDQGGDLSQRESHRSSGTKDDIPAMTSTWALDQVNPSYHQPHVKHQEQKHQAEHRGIAWPQGPRVPGCMALRDRGTMVLCKQDGYGRTRWMGPWAWIKAFLWSRRRFSTGFIPAGAQRAPTGWVLGAPRVPAPSLHLAGSGPAPLSSSPRRDADDFHTPPHPWLPFHR